MIRPLLLAAAAVCASPALAKDAGAAFPALDEAATRGTFAAGLGADCSAKQAAPRMPVMSFADEAAGVEKARAISAAPGDVAAACG